MFKIDQMGREVEDFEAIRLEFPTTGQPREALRLASDEVVERVLQKASSGFTVWGATPLEERLRHVERLAAYLVKNIDERALLITHVVGKPLFESVREVEKCIELASYYLKSASATLRPTGSNAETDPRRLKRTPLGVILCVSPSNFPLWQVVRAALPTIIAGNVVLNKPSPAGHTVSESLADDVAMAGFPEGCFQALQVSPEKIRALIAHPVIKGVAFTGGREAGRTIGAAAGQALKPSVLELGGNDPAVILESADLDEALAKCVAARFYNNGQTCLGPKRIIIHQTHYASALRQLQAMASAYSHGDPTESASKRGPMISFAARKHLHEQVMTAQKQGATLLLGGQIEGGNGAYYPSTLLSDVDPSSIVYQEELFGPVLAVSRAESTGHAIELANSSRFGLAASVFCQNRVEAAGVAERLQVANVGWNAIARSNVAYPFGGILESGYGRELGAEGLLNFTYPKTYTGFHG